MRARLIAALLGAYVVVMLAGAFVLRHESDRAAVSIVDVAVFSLLALLGYCATFFLLRRLYGSRSFVPWIPSAVGVVVGLGAFALFEAWMPGQHHIQPQVTLVSLGVLLASGLSGVYGLQIMRNNAVGCWLPPLPPVYYDVFISYAHEDLDWVLEHVYAPFTAARLPSGKRLSIYLDGDRISITTGNAWVNKIARAIDGSRFIVPVCTEAYFQKPYCRFEIRRAMRKWVANPDSVRPIMLGHPQIPPMLEDMHFRSIDDAPNLVEDVLAEIVETLSRKPAGPPEDRESAL